MFLSLTAEQGIAWLMASDESWASHAAGRYAAALERGDGGEPDDGTS